MKEQSNKKYKLKKGIIFILLALIVLVMSLISLVYLWRLNVLPFVYFIIITLFIVILNGFNIFLMKRKKAFPRILGTLISLVCIGVFSMLNIFQSTTLDFLHQILEKKYHFETYHILVLKNSSINNLKDLNQKEVAIGNYDENEVNELKNKIKKKTELNYHVDEIDNLIESLDNEEYNAIILNESDFQILMINKENYTSEYKEIEKMEIKSKVTDTKKYVNVVKQPFSIYIIGVDSYGKIGNSGRSDVNMVLSANPETGKILLTSIPRDYYVSLYGKNAKDKITHAGVYGTETAQKTLENLLETDINYYAKFNFNALINLVEAIGGIEIDNPKEFKAFFTDEQDNFNVVNYNFKKGINKLNGKQALAFVRERKAFALGDRIRVTNQQLVLEAVLKKLMGGSIVKNYTEILSVLGNSFQTNMPINNITDLIKWQIKENKKWTIESQVLEGTDSSEYTFSYKKSKSYVMMPDEESIKEAVNKINEVKAED